MLGLLVAGLTDEVIARTLGVSVRTSRRMTAALMDRPGPAAAFSRVHRRPSGAGPAAERGRPRGAP